MDQALLVLTNVPDVECAQLVARTLIEARLAACVNLLPAVQSMYLWQGQIEEATEITLLIKTTSQHYDSVQQAIVKLHPYDVPEIIATPIVAGSAPYLQWIATETAKENNA